MLQYPRVASLCLANTTTMKKMTTNSPTSTKPISPIKVSHLQTQVHVQHGCIASVSIQTMEFNLHLSLQSRQQVKLKNAHDLKHQVCTWNITLLQALIKCNLVPPLPQSYLPSLMLQLYSLPSHPTIPTRKIKMVQLHDLSLRLCQNSQKCHRFHLITLLF